MTDDPQTKRRARGTTTGSSTRPLISFRAPTAEHYDRLARRAAARGTTVNALAKERVFPARRPKAHSASR